MTEKAKDDLLKKITFKDIGNSYLAGRLAFLYNTIVHCMPDTDIDNKKIVLDLLNDIIQEFQQFHKIENDSLKLNDLSKIQ